MNSVHLVLPEAYDVLGKCQNFLDSFVVWANYFLTEGVTFNRRLLETFVSVDIDIDWTDHPIDSFVNSSPLFAF